MQTRKSILVSLTLLLALTLFFTALPLYAAANGNTAAGNAANGSTAGGSTVGGMLEDAADAVRGAAEDRFGSRRDAGNAAEGNNENVPDGNLTDAPDNGSLTDGNTAGNNTSGNAGGSGK